MEKVKSKTIKSIHSLDSSNKSSTNDPKNEVSDFGNSDLNATTDSHRTCSSFGAYFNIVCVVGGTGTLGLPYAVKTGGWLSILIIFVSGFIAYTSGKQVIECLYHKTNGKPIAQRENNDNFGLNTRLSSMADIGEAAFGKIGRYVVLSFNFSIMLGFSCLYIILTGLNMHAIAMSFVSSTFDLKLYILIGGGFVLIPYVLFKNLKEVAILAIFGALATLVVIVVAIVVGLLDLPNHLEETREIVNLRGIPLALSTISFSFGANVVYPHVEGSMRSPKSWSKVLGCAMITVTLAYILIGIIGYRVYGDNVQSPILESLPKGIPYLIATILITLHVILAAPIFLCSFSLEIEKLAGTENYGKYKELIFRTATRVITVAVLIVVAMFIPFFNDFMSLVGALCNGFIIFVIPPLCHFKLFGFKNRPIYDYLWIAFILLIGFICCVLGVIDSITALVNDFHGNTSTGIKHL